MFTSQNKHKNNIFFMNLALNQARKTLGNTKNNPAVGCVITKNDYIISLGCTSINGRPHAETNAIDFLKGNIANSTLYVTLEPCSHYGETPPCVNLIVKRKFKKVFYSIPDPDIRSFNKCKNSLRKQNIYVNEGILKNKVNFFYRSYLKNKRNELPFVTCKLAISKDYFTVNKKKKFITNKYSRGRVHLLRSTHDCIISSSTSINKDDSQLTCRIEGLKNRSPSRIILDNKLKIKINSKIIKESTNHTTIIFYNKKNTKKINLLKKLKIKLVNIPLDQNGNLDIKKSLAKAKKLGFSRIFLESGQKLTTSFLNKNLIDDFKLFISNSMLRKNGKDRINSFLRSLIKNKKGIKEKINLFGEKLISYKIR